MSYQIRGEKKYLHSTTKFLDAGQVRHIRARMAMMDIRHKELAMQLGISQVRLSINLMYKDRIQGWSMPKKTYRHIKQILNIK